MILEISEPNREEKKIYVICQCVQTEIMGITLIFYLKNVYSKEVNSKSLKFLIQVGTRQKKFVCNVRSEFEGRTLGLVFKFSLLILKNFYINLICMVSYI